MQFYGITNTPYYEYAVYPVVLPSLSIKLSFFFFKTSL